MTDRQQPPQGSSSAPGLQSRSGPETQSPSGPETQSPTSRETQSPSAREAQAPSGPEQQPSQVQPGEREASDGDDDWEWRRRIRANPHSYRIYRWVVGIVGTLVTLGGLVAVPAPGPGWLIVFVGVGILASEFEWAQRLLQWGRARLDDWNAWLAPKPWWFKGLVGLATLVLVLAVFYGLFLLSGVPGFFPDLIEERLTRLPGLG